MSIASAFKAPRSTVEVLGGWLMLYRVPLLFAPQAEGGFTVTSPALPELITEGDTLAEAFANAQDALAAVVELYADEGRQLPDGITLPASGQVVWSDALVVAP